MGATIGSRVKTERELRGWTQEDLEYRSGVAFRTIQRIEAERVNPQITTLAKLAAALNTDVSRLLTGLDLEDVTELVDDCSCGVCGARLVERTFVDHEYGDCEYEVFECGGTRGWRERPCPKDPRFPDLAEYEFRVEETGDGQYACYARGVTAAAREVHLRHGIGDTEEEARRQVRWTYIAIKEGSDAADRIVGSLYPGLE